MSRPEQYTDLPETERRSLVVRIEPELVENLTVTEVDALLQVREILTDVFQSETGCGETSYYRPLSTGEQLEALEGAKRRWDHFSRLYNDAARGITPKYAYQRHDIDKWSVAEGIDPIDWDSIDAAEAEEAGE